MVLKVTSLNDQSQFVEAKLTLIINPYVQFKAEVRPQKMRSEQGARVTVFNYGNRLETFAVNFTDSAEEILFDPPSLELTVPPNQSGTQVFRAKPRAVRWMGGEKDHAISAQVAPFKAEPQIINATLVSRALIPSWVPPIAVLFCMMCAGLVLLARPLLQIPNTGSTEAFTTTSAIPLLPPGVPTLTAAMTLVATSTPVNTLTMTLTETATATPTSSPTNTASLTASVTPSLTFTPSLTSIVSINRFLVKRDPNNPNGFIPDLAISWDVDPDGRIYVFRLRQGVNMITGQPFTSAVAIDKLFQWPWARSGEATLEAVDDFTIAVRCNTGASCLNILSDFSQLSMGDFPP
jgi:hypothetical protein